MEDPRLQAPALLSRRRNELQAERQRIVQQGLYIDPTPSDSEWNSDEEDRFSYSRASDISFASTTATFTPGLLRDVPVAQRGNVPLPEPEAYVPLAGRTRGARTRHAGVTTSGGGLTGQTLEWLDRIHGVAEMPRRLESVSSFVSSSGASIAPSPSASGASAGAGWFQSSSTFGLAREFLFFFGLVFSPAVDKAPSFFLHFSGCTSSSYAYIRRRSSEVAVASRSLNVEIPHSISFDDVLIIHWVYSLSLILYMTATRSRHYVLLQYDIYPPLLIGSHLHMTVWWKN